MDFLSGEINLRQWIMYFTAVGVLFAVVLAVLTAIIWGKNWGRRVLTVFVVGLLIFLFVTPPGLTSHVGKGIGGIWESWMKDMEPGSDIRIAAFLAAIALFGLAVLLWEKSWGKVLIGALALIGTGVYFIPDFGEWLVKGPRPLELAIAVVLACLAVGVRKAAIAGEALGTMLTVVAIAVVVYATVPKEALVASKGAAGDIYRSVTKPSEKKTKPARAETVAAKPEPNYTSAECPGVVTRRTVGGGWQTFIHPNCRVYYEVAPLPEYDRPCVDLSAQGVVVRKCRGDDNDDLPADDRFLAQSAMKVGYGYVGVTLCVIHVRPGMEPPGIRERLLTECQ